MVVLCGLGSIHAMAGSEEGAAVYSAKCKTCHGADGQGNPGMAKMLKVTFKPLNSQDIQSMSDIDLKKIITEGKGKMTKVAVGGTDLDNLVAYLRTAFKK